MFCLKTLDQMQLEVSFLDSQTKIINITYQQNNYIKRQKNIVNANIKK